MCLTLLVAYHSPEVAQQIALGARMNCRVARVVFAVDGAETLECFEQEHPDLVILDSFTASPDAFDVCRRLRSCATAPILILAAHYTSMDVVRALDLGADDVVLWPCDILELLARVRALVRRTHVLSPAPIETSDFELDAATHDVGLDGLHIHLTPTEYRLLEELMRHGGAPVPHRILLERVWGFACVNDVQYLKVFIQRLRQKLSGTAAATSIHTERGIGYSFVPPGHLHQLPDNLRVN